ncbi:MAG TPA: phosphopentomutase [Nitrospiraceae bacterium]|jgi:phosphopentomutase|nr:phosphopentomutase [Nitrospiraceae bacterium]
MVDRVILMVLDGLGVGALPDAAEYGDADCNTLAHVAEEVGGLAAPNLEALGLGHLGCFKGVRPIGQPHGCFGRLGFLSKGKDSLTGLWELAGVSLDEPLPAYPGGIPQEVVDIVQGVSGRKILGSRIARATDIVDELGPEHLRDGALILFTSGGSDLQVAAHETVVEPEALYALCRKTRRALKSLYRVPRIVARPFSGEVGAFVLTDKRRDFVPEPTGQTLLDVLSRSGQLVMGIGKIDDLFAGRGLTRSTRGGSIIRVFEEMGKVLSQVPRGLIFASVDLAGRSAPACAAALQEFDRLLPRLQEQLRPGDLLCLTADHGADPIGNGQIHSREYAPLLISGPKLAHGVDLGTRPTAADLGQTIAEALGVPRLACGESFLDALRPG